MCDKDTVLMSECSIGANRFSEMSYGYGRLTLVPKAVSMTDRKPLTYVLHSLHDYTQPHQPDAYQCIVSD